MPYPVYAIHYVDHVLVCVSSIVMYGMCSYGRQGLTAIAHIFLWLAYVEGAMSFLAYESIELIMLIFAGQSIFILHFIMFELLLNIPILINSLSSHFHITD